MVSSIEVLTVQEASEILKCTASHIYDLVSEGVIPHLRFGKSIRIPTQKFREWMEANTQPGKQIDQPEELANVG